ncbi:MAG: FecR domain-containing protein [Saprospiraceae bacterium]
MNEKNLQLDILSLAEEQAFISWVKNGTDSSAWKLWLAAHPDQLPKVEEAKKLVKTLQFDTTSVLINKEKLWGRIEKSTEGKEILLKQNMVKVRKIWRRSFIGLAASILVLMAAVFLMKDNVEVLTSNGENMVYTMPDNSKVYINAGSELSFDRNSWEKNRKVTLNGEAFFEVEKGSTFVVMTDNGNVKVLGTKFNVYSRATSLQVKCTEGKVEVTATSGGQEVLNAGDVVELNNKVLEKIPFQAKFDWRQKAYSYRAATLKDVFGEIERQFDVKIVTNAKINEMSYSGALETKDLKKAIYMVTWPMGLDYNIKQKTIEIFNK